MQGVPWPSRRVLLSELKAQLGESPPATVRNPLQFQLAGGDTKNRAKRRERRLQVLRRKTDNFGRAETQEHAFL
jgi:hypothetical protein